MDATYRAVNGVGRLALRLLGVDVRWTGVESVPLTGPVVLAANHVSFPDFVFVERAAISRRRHVRFLCRHDAWHGRALTALMDGMGHVPVDRRDGSSAYLRARALLRSGEAVGIFPEAGISWSYTVRPLMRGAAALARDTGAPLVPVAVWGGQRIFSVGATRHRPDLTRGRRVDLAFGAPRHVRHAEDLTSATRWLGHELTVLLDSLQRLPHHQPRAGEYAEWHPAHLGGRAPDARAARELETVPRGAVPATWGPAATAPRVARPGERRPS